MGFRNLEIKKEYRSLQDNIASEFYIPLLSESILYKRAVGFFSSTSLAEISKGITGLVRNGGQILLVASPYLSEDDLQAINRGYELRNQIIEHALTVALEEPKDQFEESRLNLLANLIAEERLHLKIAFTERDQMLGMYHEKMGLIYDSNDNVVAFSGSMNETGTAMTLNYEAIDVYCSWKEDAERVDVKEKAFNKIWNNSDPNIQIIDFPKLNQEILRRYRKGPSDLSIDEKEYFQKTTQYRIKNEGPFLPGDIQLYDYQLEAIDKWGQQGYRGIFDMATGTGKTLTGLGAIVKLTEHLDQKLGVFIVCPYQHLVEQWVEDILKFNMEPIIGYSSSSQKNWKQRLKNAIFNQKLGVKGCDFFCFICTNATYASDFVQTQIKKIRRHALLVVDEAHNFGAIRLSRLLTEAFNYRLALSATLERHQDEEGTERLKTYFGEKCIEYPLERAIKENKLTPYKYYPIITCLNEKELQIYNHLSQQIFKCIIKDKYGRNNLSEQGKRIALRRARLVAAAESKIEKLREVMESYKDRRHLLVYCGAASLLGDEDEWSQISDEDIRQIDAVTHMLGNEMGMKVSQFTSRENIKEREILKKEFESGENLQALIAIKCLDEGVNIPNIRVAFILASTTNPKEYIQRRGRVLRRAPGKNYAEIYDFITIPRPLNDVFSLTAEEVKYDLSLIKKEVNRAEEFARAAMNTMEADITIQEIKEVYKLHSKYTEFSIE